MRWNVILFNKVYSIRFLSRIPAWAASQWAQTTSPLHLPDCQVPMTAGRAVSKVRIEESFGDVLLEFCCENKC